MPESLNVAHLDFSETGFSIRSDQVMQAREQHWYATTNFGIAILRYEDSNALLKDKRVTKIPTHCSKTSGFIKEPADGHHTLG